MYKATDWPGPEVNLFFGEIGLEVTFELHRRTANLKCPALVGTRTFKKCLAAVQTPSVQDT